MYKRTNSDALFFLLNNVSVQWVESNSAWDYHSVRLRFVCGTDYLKTEKGCIEESTQRQETKAWKSFTRANSFYWGMHSKQYVSVLRCDHHTPIGQLSYTCLAMSAAESFGENRNSFVFPLTKMSLKLIWNTNTNNIAVRSSVRIHTTLPHQHEIAFSTHFNL